MEPWPTTTQEYFSGFQYAKAMVQKFPKKWTRQGLFTYKNTPLWETKDIFLAPEQLLLALAQHERGQKFPTLLLLDTNRQHSFSLTQNRGYTIFQDLLQDDQDKVSLFRFGKTEHTKLQSLPVVKVDSDWLAHNPAALARVVEDISPLQKEPDIQKLEKRADLGESKNISALLQRFLGPPTISDDIREQLRTSPEKDKEAASLASAAISAAVNPTLLLFRGAKYVYGFARMLSKRRSDERKDMLTQWRSAVEEAYTPENINELVGKDSTIDTLCNALLQNQLCVVMNTTYETYYDVFLPALLAQIIDQGQPSEVTPLLILDGTAYLLKSRFAEDLVLSLANQQAPWRVASFVHTYDPPEEARLNKLTRAFVQEAAVIFDVAPEHFEFAFNGLAVSQRAWLLRRFEEIAHFQQQNKLGYLTYDQSDRVPWTLREVQPKPRHWLTARLRETRKALSTFTTSTKEFFEEFLLGEKRMPDPSSQNEE